MHLICAQSPIVSARKMTNLRNTMAGVRLTRSERDVLRCAAARDGLPLAAMIRRAALREARSILRHEGDPEIEAATTEEPPAAGSSVLEDVGGDAERGR